MRPRQAQGRPGTPVIPAGWGQTHGLVVDGSHTSHVKIAAPGTAPAWDAAEGTTRTRPAVPVYDGPATLMGISNTDTRVTVVEDTLVTRLYDVTLLHDAGDIAVDMVISVDPADDDPMLAGKQLRVRSVERGSRRFSRVILALLIN